MMRRRRRQAEPDITMALISAAYRRADQVLGSAPPGWRPHRWRHPVTKRFITVLDAADLMLPADPGYSAR